MFILLRLADDIGHLWRYVRASVLVVDWRKSSRLEWICERSMGGRVQAVVMLKEEDRGRR